MKARSFNLDATMVIFWPGTQMIHQSNDLHTYCCLIYWFRCIFQIMKYYLRPILGCRKIEIYLKDQSMLLDFTNTSELWQKPRKRILRACLVFWQSLNINPCFPPTQTHNTVSSTATASGCHWDFLRRK